MADISAADSYKGLQCRSERGEHKCMYMHACTFTCIHLYKVALRILESLVTWLTAAAGPGRADENTDTTGGSRMAGVTKAVPT